MFITLSQYHGCWCQSNTRNQGIRSHDIDLVLPENSNQHQKCSISDWNIRYCKICKHFESSISLLWNGLFIKWLAAHENLFFILPMFDIKFSSVSVVENKKIMQCYLFFRKLVFRCASSSWKLLLVWLKIPQICFFLSLMLLGEIRFGESHKGTHNPQYMRGIAGNFPDLECRLDNITGMGVTKLIASFPLYHEVDIILSEWCPDKPNGK